MDIWALLKKGDFVIEGGFGECALVLVFGAIAPFFVPSFRFLGGPSFCFWHPHSDFGDPGNIRQNHSFGNHLVLRTPEVSGSLKRNPKLRTNTTTTRDRNLQFRGAVSTGGSPLDFFLFRQVLCAIWLEETPKIWRK